MWLKRRGPFLLWKTKTCITCVYFKTKMLKYFHTFIASPHLYTMFTASMFAAGRGGEEHSRPYDGLKCVSFNTTFKCLYSWKTHKIQNESSNVFFFCFLFDFPSRINEFGCVVMQPGCDLLLTQLLLMDPLQGIKCSLQLPYFTVFAVISWQHWKKYILCFLYDGWENVFKFPNDWLHFYNNKQSKAEKNSTRCPIIVLCFYPLMRKTDKV